MPFKSLLTLTIARKLILSFAIPLAVGYFSTLISFKKNVQQLDANTIVYDEVYLYDFLWLKVCFAISVFIFWWILWGDREVIAGKTSA